MQSDTYALRQEIRTRCEGLTMSQCVERYLDLYGPNENKTEAAKKKGKTFGRFLGGIPVNEASYFELCPFINLKMGWNLRFGDFCEEEQIGQLDRLKRIREATIEGVPIRANEQHFESCADLRRDFFAIEASLPPLLPPPTAALNTAVGSPIGISAPSHPIVETSKDTNGVGVRHAPAQGSPSRQHRPMILRGTIGLGLLVLLSLGALAISGYFSSPPLPLNHVSVAIEVSQEAEQSVPLSEAKLPLIAGDALKLTVKSNEPAYFYLIWLDAAGNVSPIWPWEDRLWNSRSRQMEKSGTSFVLPPQDSPTKEKFVYLKADKPGLNGILVIARRTPLGSDASLKDVISGFSLEGAASPLYSNVVVEIDREGIKRNRKRLPLSNELLQLPKNPLSQLHEFISNHASETGDAAHAICFSFGTVRD
jgi:hypothetical protein